MKDKLTKDLDIKAFSMVYSILSFIAYIALCRLFMVSSQLLTSLFLEEHELHSFFLSDKFPWGSAVIVVTFMAVNIFRTNIFIKYKGDNSEQNISATLQIDFTFLLFSLIYLIFYFVDEIVISFDYTNSTEISLVLISVFLVSLIFIGAYNCLAICTIKFRKEIFSENGIFHFFIKPISILLTLAGLIMEFTYIFTLNTLKFKTQWWEIVYPLALYAICFIFLIVLTKKSKLTADLSKRILTTTVTLTLILRVLFVCICLSVWGFDYTCRLLIVLIMTIPCLAGPYVAKRITNKKQ